MTFRRAVVQLIVGALIISTSAPWAKLAEVPPTVSAFYRMLIGGLVLALICLIQRQLNWLSLRTLLWMLIPALFFAADMYVWHRSIEYVGPGLATILGNLQVFVVALVGILLFRERPGLLFFVGVVFAFAGIALLVGLDWPASTEQYRWGIWFGVLTAICYAGYILTMQSSQRGALVSVSPVSCLAAASLLSAAALALMTVVEGSSFAVGSNRTWLILIVYGVFCQAIGWILITQAMRAVPAFLIGLLLLIQPSASFLWDVIFFDRPTGISDGIGVGLVLVGIYLASARVRSGVVS